MGIAKATVPNVCKMPGPPAPFVPTPLPNIGKSGMSPKGYSKKVKIEGQTVAIFGATFKSMGDMASKGTGGGLISANAHGVTKFITPGSLTVTIEGKGVHLKGEPMLNNCAAPGVPPNTGATLAGLSQRSAKKIRALKNKLCKEFCDEIAAGWTSSSDFEKKLKKKWATSEPRVKFATDTRVRHVFNGAPRTTIPDAGFYVGGKLTQCFDFKFPGDRWRNDQMARQTRLARRKPIEISRTSCGC